MPKLDLRQNVEHKDLTLADVSVGEWWLDEAGTPYQRESDCDCVYYNADENTFCVSEMNPQDVRVYRKLCGLIELIWE